MQLESGVVVFAGGKWCAPETAGFLVSPVIMRWKRFLQPADIGRIQRRHNAAHVAQRIGRIGICQNVDLIAETAAHRFDACDVVRGRIADARSFGEPVQRGIDVPINKNTLLYSCFDICARHQR